MSRVYFYVAPGSNGWQVKSRGFAWDCDSKQLAMDFAASIAKDYSEATGNPTCIRLPSEDEFPFQASLGGDDQPYPCPAFDRDIQVARPTPSL